MIDEMRFLRDTATYEEIVAHLRLCDPDFVPPLSARVQIAEYAQKLLAHATRFEAWQRGMLVGLIAAYCNDTERNRAYITNVSVLATLQHQGVGAGLLTRCLEYINELGFADAELQVDDRNKGAIRLYERFGFQVLRSDGQSITMNLKMSKVTDE